MSQFNYVFSFFVFLARFESVLLSIELKWEKTEKLKLENWRQLVIATLQHLLTYFHPSGVLQHSQ